MAQQPQAESRIARRPRLPRPRRQRAHLPARRGGAGRRLGRHAQQQRGDARRLGRQSQATAGGQVELAQLAPGLDQRRPERAAARGLGPRLERAVAIAHPHQQDPRGIEPELGQTRRMQAAALGIEEILPDPEQWLGAGRTQRQRRGEAGGGGMVGPGPGIDLVQSGPGDAAAERFVQRGRAEGDALRRGGGARQPRQSEALPQGSQGTGGAIGHRCICSLFVRSLRPTPNGSGVKPESPYGIASTGRRPNGPSLPVGAPVISRPWIAAISHRPAALARRPP
jgi:hypothetical protein